MSTTNAKSNTPAFIAYQVRQRDGQKSIWTRIGAAWGHKDGGGYDVQLDAVPLDGRITLRVPSESNE